MKRIGLFLLAVVLVAGLAGCPDSDADPVGTWSMTGDWECDGTLHYGVWHIKPDGTFVDSTAPGSANLEVNKTGSWKVDKKHFRLTYVSGTFYDGEIDDGFMGGSCTFAGGIETGCWTATRTSTAP